MAVYTVLFTPSYRGIAKNANRLFATCALVNLFLARKKLLGMTAA